LTISAVEQLVAENPSAGIVFTGHSLGGAISCLAAFDFSMLTNQKHDDRIALYTMGQPRVGNSIFKEIYSRFSFHDRYFRLIKKGDHIPQLPFQVLGYEHIGQAFLLTDENEIVNCTDDEGAVGNCSYTLLDWSLLKNHSMVKGYCSVEIHRF
jgi:predicted lipase